jgi:hypothetical protein
MGKYVHWTLGLITILVGVVRATTVGWEVQPALAGGSSSLAEWQSLIEQSEQLREEVAIALRGVSRAPEDVFCVGARIGHPIESLSGFRIAPVTCRFGNWMLELDADNLAVQTDGTVRPVEQLLNLPMAERARFTTLRFRLQRWRWYPVAPELGQGMSEKAKN